VWVHNQNCANEIFSLRGQPIEGAIGTQGDHVITVSRADELSEYIKQMSNFTPPGSKFILERKVTVPDGIPASYSFQYYFDGVLSKNSYIKGNVLTIYEPSLPYKSLGAKANYVTYDNQAWLATVSGRVPSNILIEQKWKGAFRWVEATRDQTFMTGVNTFCDELARQSLALKQNNAVRRAAGLNPYKLVYEFANQEMLDKAIVMLTGKGTQTEFLQKIKNIMGNDWEGFAKIRVINGNNYGDWFDAEDIYFVVARQEGMIFDNNNNVSKWVERALPDEVIGFKYNNAFALESFGGINVEKFIAEEGTQESILPHLLSVMEEAQKRRLIVEEIGDFGSPWLAETEIEQIFKQAKQFWLDRGALASVLGETTFSIGNLPQFVVAETLGTHITFSPDAAGWGWFVDPTRQPGGHAGGQDHVAPTGRYVVLHRHMRRFRQILYHIEGRAMNITNKPISSPNTGLLEEQGIWINERFSP
jgi:hypothetical protein